MLGADGQRLTDVLFMLDVLSGDPSMGFTRTDGQEEWRTWNTRFRSDHLACLTT
jgi:hypothetical protein